MMICLVTCRAINRSTWCKIIEFKQFIWANESDYRLNEEEKKIKWLTNQNTEIDEFFMTIKTVVIAYQVRKIKCGKSSWANEMVFSLEIMYSTLFSVVSLVHFIFLVYRNLFYLTSEPSIAIRLLFWLNFMAFYIGICVVVFAFVFSFFFIRRIFVFVYIVQWITTIFICHNWLE